MKLSVVTTLYKSEPFLERFVDRVSKAVQELGIEDYEIIAVNDGSPDDSLTTMLKLKEANPHIVVVDLSRNFGHHYALLAGMEVSKGDFVFTIDCDLEVSPSVLSQFWMVHLSHMDVDRIYGVQETRKGKFVEKCGGSLFYRIFNSLSETKIPSNILTESLMSRQYVEEFVRMGDANLFLAGMFSWVGFNQMPLVCKKGQRETKSTYTFAKRLALSLQALTSFSAYPLRLLFTTGGCLSLISFTYGIYLIVKKLVFPSFVLSGYTSLIVLLLFSAGVIVMSLGVLGLYIEKLFNQTKNRQRYIIKHIYL
jgi:putative glycosyltransferase